jgi:TPR repeat protein
MGLRTIAFAAALFAVAATGGPAFSQCAENPDMMLAPAEVRDLTHKAQAGDKDAATRLYIHYDAGKQPHEAMKWLVEAAKLGDCPSVQTLLETPKLADKTQKLAKSYASQWACKPGGQPPPPAPIMY